MLTDPVPIEPLYRERWLVSKGQLNSLETSFNLSYMGHMPFVFVASYGWGSWQSCGLPPGRKKGICFAHSLLPPIVRYSDRRHPLMLPCRRRVVCKGQGFNVQQIIPLRNVSVQFNIECTSCTMLRVLHNTVDICQIFPCRLEENTFSKFRTGILQTTQQML